MSVFQPEGKGTNWHYRFMFNGQVIRRSTKQTNHKVALQLEAEHKSLLAKGDMGIFERTPAPTFAAFAKEFLEMGGGGISGEAEDSGVLPELCRSLAGISAVDVIGNE